MAKDKIQLHPDNPRNISEKQYNQLKTWMKKYGDLSGIVHNQTTGNIVSGNQRGSILDITTAKITITEKLTKPAKDGTLSTGYVVYEGNKFAYRLVRWTNKKEREALVIANHAGGEFDFDILGDSFADLPLGDWGFDQFIKEPEFEPAENNNDAGEYKYPEDGIPVSHVRMVQLFLNEQSAEKFKSWEIQLRKKFNTENLTDTIFAAVEYLVKKK